jgi:hypothetical protein
MKLVADIHVSLVLRHGSLTRSATTPYMFPLISIAKRVPHVLNKVTHASLTKTAAALLTFVVKERAVALNEVKPALLTGSVVESTQEKQSVKRELASLPPATSVKPRGRCADETPIAARENAEERVELLEDASSRETIG